MLTFGQAHVENKGPAFPNDSKFILGRGSWARHLLASALLRNNRLPKVTVVSRREGINDWTRMNYWKDYCRNLGKMSQFYPMTFEEWVLKQA
jgi:hypothetical protein